MVRQAGKEGKGRKDVMEEVVEGFEGGGNKVISGSQEEGGGEAGVEVEGGTGKG